MICIVWKISACDQHSQVCTEKSLSRRERVTRQPEAVAAGEGYMLFPVLSSGNGFTRRAQYE